MSIFQQPTFRQTYLGLGTALYLGTIYFPKQLQKIHFLANKYVLMCFNNYYYFYYILLSKYCCSILYVFLMFSQVKIRSLHSVLVLCQLLSLLSSPASMFLIFFSFTSQAFILIIIIITIINDYYLSAFNYFSYLVNFSTVHFCNNAKSIEMNFLLD